MHEIAHRRRLAEIQSQEMKRLKKVLKIWSEVCKEKQLQLFVFAFPIGADAVKETATRLDISIEEASSLINRACANLCD